MSTKYQRIVAALERALERGDIDAATFDMMAGFADAMKDELNGGADFNDLADKLERKLYQRDHAADYRKHDR